MSVEKVTRNDFTPTELDEAMEEGQVIDAPYIPNPNYQEESKAWTAKYGNNQFTDAARVERPQYFLLDENGKIVQEEERLVSIEDADDSWYEFPDYLHGLGHFKVIDSGDLGDGHESWVLVQHVESGRFFRKAGWYSSWDGGGFDDPVVEVEPAEVKVVRYQDIKTKKIFDNPAVTV